MNISNKALIVNLKISQWTGRKLDRQATDAVEHDFKTAGRVGNYTKKLLPKSAELERVARLVSAMRAYFYEQTLPWYSDGSRIISSKAYLEFTQEFGKRKREFEDAVNAFLNNYDRLQRNAEATLGDLYRAQDYPTKERLRQCFDCEIAFFPVPDVSDFRTEVSEVEKEAFRKAIRETEAAAVSECYKRLHGVISRATEKLSDPNAVFRDSLIQNIKDLCKLLPKLNVTEDLELEAMRTEVEAVIQRTSAEHCRSNPDARKQTAEALKDSMARMRSAMGGGS